jgi:malate dehydrogenase (oxaloacetate-decarboxylating)
MSDYFDRSLIIHEQLRGKMGIQSRMPILSRDDLSIAYTPGVARPCEAIAKDPSRTRDLTIKRNTVAVVSDGSAVLGLGNIGPNAAIPVMEGKAILFKEFAGIDAWPICLDTQESDEIIDTVRRIAPVFGGINLEDISAPRCFEIEQALQDLGIPVFHDDQHGTAIVLSSTARAPPAPRLQDSCVVSATTQMFAFLSKTLSSAIRAGPFTENVKGFRIARKNCCRTPIAARGPEAFKRY